MFSSMIITLICHHRDSSWFQPHFSKQNTHKVKRCPVNIRWIAFAKVIREKVRYDESTLVPIKSNNERTLFEITTSEQFVRRFVKEHAVSIWHPGIAILPKAINANIELHQFVERAILLIMHLETTTVTTIFKEDRPILLNYEEHFL